MKMHRATLLAVILIVLAVPASNAGATGAKLAPAPNIFSDYKPPAETVIPPGVIEAERAAQKAAAAGPRWIPSDSGLEGLHEVAVAISYKELDWADRLSLENESIRTRVELYLRRVPGLTVTPDPEYPAPIISVCLDGWLLHPKGSSASYGYAAIVRIALVQPVIVVRSDKDGDGKGRVLLLDAGITWDRAMTVGGPVDLAQREEVMGAITDLLDAFQNEYLKANPPKPEGK